MKTKYASLLTPLFAVVMMTVTFSLDGFTQSTPPGTAIKSQATATFKDSKGVSYNIESNTVTFTVSKVAGLTISTGGDYSDERFFPFPGERPVGFLFRVRNTGNFKDKVRFLANGKSIRIEGPATLSSAKLVDPVVFDLNSGLDIFTNTEDVLHSLNPDQRVIVYVKLATNKDAPVGGTIRILLGDAATGTNFDNVPADNSANEVRTVSTDAVNGLREARGEIVVPVRKPEFLKANMIVPAGPMILGSTIRYTMKVCRAPNAEVRDILLVAPIPRGTVLTNVSLLPSGTQFSTSPLDTTTVTLDNASRISGEWISSPPSDLSTVTRISIKLNIILSSVRRECIPDTHFDVKITTTDTATPIYAIFEAFALIPLGTPRLVSTDQSGDNIASKGDGNANFDEPVLGAPASPTQGFQQPTYLTNTSLASVLIGPNGAPNATGPTDNNDDYTNLSVSPSGAGIFSFLGEGIHAQKTAIFINTIQNKGSVNDTFALTAPVTPPDASVEISIDGGTTYKIAGGSRKVNLMINANESANIKVKVTLPARKAAFTEYDTVIRAISQHDSSQRNETINRLYTGFVKISTDADKSVVSLPGTVITYRVKYENISSTGGVGSIGLTAANLVITEDGSAGRNNWDTMTVHVPGSAVDTSGGAITGDTAGSNKLTVTITSLPPGASGTFTFKRRVK